MVLKLYNETDINNIAKAINNKGISGKFTVGEMADAVMEIESGGVEPTTSLVLNSNKVKTTGNVTLTAQLMTDRYYSSDDVSENGFVEGATVTFYKMLGSTPNPSIDSAISTSITNSSGVAICDTTITANSTLYATYGGDFQSATSNNVNVEYISYLFYDSCSSSTGLTNYDLPVNVEGGDATATITYDSSMNAYKLTSINSGVKVYPIKQLDYEDNFKLSLELNITSSNSLCLGLGILGSNNSYFGFILDNGRFCGHRFDNDRWRENYIFDYPTYYNDWLKLELQVTNGVNVIATFKNLDGTVIATTSQTLSSSYHSQSKNKFCLDIGYSSSRYGYVRNIIAEAI